MKTKKRSKKMTKTPFARPSRLKRTPKKKETKTKMKKKRKRKILAPDQAALLVPFQKSPTEGRRINSGNFRDLF